jgi:hypothetical protein
MRANETRKPEPGDETMNGYYPEMNEKAPADTQIEASLSHYGEHYYLRTPLVLKGRGITHTKTITAEDFPAGRMAGWHCYRVTTKAMQKLEQQYVVAIAMNL